MTYFLLFIAALCLYKGLGGSFSRKPKELSFEEKRAKACIEAGERLQKYAIPGKRYRHPALGLEGCPNAWKNYDKWFRENLGEPRTRFPTDEERAEREAFRANFVGPPKPEKVVVLPEVKRCLDCKPGMRCWNAVS